MKNDDLAVGWHIHMKALLHERNEPRTARGVPDFGLELDARGIRGVTLLLENSQRTGLADAECRACNDARGHREETGEEQHDERPRAQAVLAPRSSHRAFATP